jgi:hypothetical protein
LVWPAGADVVVVSPALVVVPPVVVVDPPEPPAGVVVLAEGFVVFDDELLSLLPQPINRSVRTADKRVMRSFEDRTMATFSPVAACVAGTKCPNRRGKLRRW